MRLHGTNFIKYVALLVVSQYEPGILQINVLLLKFIVTNKCLQKYAPQNSIRLTTKYFLSYLLYTFNEMTYTNHAFTLILIFMWLLHS
jgi:hypothetical protein